jgi:hypothetical protein
MGTFNAIRDVSEILKGILDTALGEIGAGCIVHDLVTTPAVGMTLTLTLYEIAEDPATRNRPDLRILVNDRIETRWPPASLLLRYLLTAWSGNILDDQRILGRAIHAATVADFEALVALAAELTGELDARPAIARASSPALEATATLDVTAAIADVSARLFPAEPTTPILAMSRFRDLDARVRFEPDCLRVRVPLGRRMPT